jgi:hypothetical protein
MQNSEIRAYLVDKLKDEHCFWSYNVSTVQEIPDNLLVEMVMLYLDINEINLLFQLLPFKDVKKAWLEGLVAQGEKYYLLNVFFSWYYFHIKDPKRYVKSMATRFLNKRLAL